MHSIMDPGSIPNHEPCSCYDFISLFLRLKVCIVHGTGRLTALNITMINRNSHYRQLEPDILIRVEAIIAKSGHFLELGYRSKICHYIIFKVHTLQKNSNSPLNKKFSKMYSVVKNNFIVY